MARQQAIETFWIDAVKDEELPRQIEGFRDLPSIARSVMSECLVVCDTVDESYQPMLPFEATDTLGSIGRNGEVIQFPTKDHRRSTVLKGKDMETAWTDEHGNYYSALTLKGINFSHSMLMESMTAVDRIIAYGLQESAIIRRVLKASRLLREAGVATEFIVGLVEPKEYQIRQNGILVDSKSRSNIDYNRNLGKKYWEQLPEEERNFDRLGDIFSKLEASTYYISMRASDTEYRVHDILIYQNARKQFFDDVNQRFGTEFDADNNDDLNEYLTTIAGPAIGRNLAKLHKLGLAHRFTNLMNVTAYGGIIDLDSVHGEPLGLGDEPVTVDDMVTDISRLFDSGNYGYIYYTPNFSSFQDSIIESYFEAVDELYDYDEAIRFKIQLFNRLKSQGKIIHNDIENSLVIKNHQNGIERTIFKDGSSDAMLSDWLNNDEQLLRQQITEVLRANITRYSEWILFDAVYSNFIDAEEFPPIEDPSFKIANYVFNSDFVTEKATLSQMYTDLMKQLIDDSFKTFFIEHVREYLNDRYKDLPLSDEDLRSLASSTTELYTPGTQIDKWIFSRIKEFITENIDELDSECSNRVSEQLKPELGSMPVAISTNRIIHESSGLSLRELVKLSDENDIEIVLPDHSSGIDISLADISHETSEDSEIIEIFASTYLESYMPEFDDPNQDLRLTTIHCSVNQAEYIAILEKDKDGKRKLTLYLQSTSMIKELIASSNSDYTKQLEKILATKSTLF